MELQEMVYNTQYLLLPVALILFVACDAPLCIEAISS